METTTMIPQWTLGDRLRKARQSAQLGTSEMGRALGCARNTITNYETGRTSPPRSVLLAWAMATGVDVDWLMGDDDPLVTNRYVAQDRRKHERRQLGGRPWRHRERRHLADRRATATADGVHILRAA